EQAVTAMQGAIDAREGGPTPALWSELALAQLATGDRGSAERSLRQAIELDGSYATARYLLANVLAAQERWDDAGDEFEEYLRLEPHGAQAPQARERLRVVRGAARDARAHR